MGENFGIGTRGRATPLPPRGAPGMARRAFGRREASRLAVALGLGALGGGCEDDGQAPEGGAALGDAGLAAAAAPAQFPLAIHAGERFLRDAAGQPFLVHGDTAWSLIAQLPREAAEAYLEDRRGRLFNTLLVSLLESRFSSNPPANAYGERPFLGQADYATPNERYFAHAEWVLRKAGALGFLVLLTPSYIGAGGGAEGWYRQMLAGGAETLRGYGRYLARRFRDLPNILWVHGGDDNPPDKAVVNAIAEGIAETDGRWLHTAHCGAETAALDYWRGERWLRVNTLYTYGPVHAGAERQWARPERMPFFLIESAYENEHGATEWRLRSQAYQAVLCGAAGQVFGNNPIWHFDGPEIHPAPVGWREALDSRGAQSMTHLRRLLDAVPWWQLVPDTDGKLLSGNPGSGHGRAVAALSSDRSLAIVYLPRDRSITLDLASLAGPRIRARWYDPAAGRLFAIGGAAFAAQGERVFRPRARNGAGLEDWVLLLTAVPGA